MEVAARKLMASGVKQVLVKLGAKGCILLHGAMTVQSHWILNSNGY